MRLRPRSLLLGVVGLIIGVAAVLALREATLSTHHPLARSLSTRVVLEAETKGGEHNQTIEEMVESVILTCRLEVASDPTAKIVSRGDGIFEAELAPALDETNRRQLRGCLEDWTIDHLRIDVLSVEHT